MKDKTGSYRFVVSGADAGRVSGSVVLLYPFKSLAAREFSFPFHGTSKVRDALKLQYKPLLGEGMRSVGFMPFFTRTEKKSSAGCLFITHESETEAAEGEAVGISDDCAIWPAPLAFAGEVGPDGLIVWSEGECVVSVWIRDWTPALYRAAPPGATPEDEERDALAYIERAGGTADKVLVVDSSDVSVDSLQACGARTIQFCPAYAQLDLSSRGANIQEEREKLLDSVARAARAALISGVACLLVAAALYSRQSSALRAAASGPGATYETAFGERSMQPVASAMSRLREASDGGRPMSMSSVLEDISSAYGSPESSADIGLELLRYGSDSAEVQGSAAGNEVIQKFRGNMEELGYIVKIENIQTIPGGKMRFGMSMSRPAAGSGQARQ